jgi:DnaJ family protein C protein 9
MVVDDIYACFGLSNSATTKEIKDSYKKLLIKLHPDKNTDKSPSEIDQLSREFVEITSYYKVLVDPIKRKKYDQTGSLEAEASDLNWKDYFDEMYKITAEDIEKFKESFRYSEQEKQEVLEEYVKQKGCLLSIIECVKLSDFDDIPRFQKIIEDAIEKGLVGKYKKFPKISKKELNKRLRKKKEEEKEAEELMEQLESKSNLEMIIKKKNEDRLKNLIEKLQGDSDLNDMPSEEEFLKTREKMENKRMAEKEDISKKRTRTREKE